MNCEIGVVANVLAHAQLVVSALLGVLGVVAGVLRHGCLGKLDGAKVRAWAE